MVRLADPYYLVNGLLVFAYLPLRLYFTTIIPEGSAYSRLHSLTEYLTWERQACATVVAVIAWKGLRRRSLDHFAQQVFFYGQVLVALTAVMVDIRLFIWYSLAALAAWVAFPQPMLHMASRRVGAKVVDLNPVRMKELVLKSPSNWLVSGGVGVYFYTENHGESIAMAPAFAELADKYSGKINFGCIDACMWPRFSRDLKVKPNSWSNQLPAVVMYSNGQEQGRIPAATQTDELGMKKNYYTKRDIVKKFALDDLWSDETPTSTNGKSSKQRSSSIAVAKQK